MINADEHKKLLAQIAELEKDSVNYFDVEKEFFLIDSDNLPQVRPWLNDFIDRQDIRSMDFDSDNLSRVRSRLYGYSIQRTGIYENDDLTPEAIAGLDGRGCYIYVEVKDGKITIKQDLNGSWGIYLFRHGDYFALSNSLFRLLDHVKFKYPLTVNRDYCHYLIVNDLCSHVYSQTAVKEVQLLDRSTILHIDISTQSLELELIDYHEQTIALNTAQGIATLDRWFEFWCSVLQGVAQHTPFITADLSGGFDSRISFVLLLHSGIDCNKIKINSYPTSKHEEDYNISSKIAEHYGFKLNQSLPASNYLNYSLADVFNSNFYNRQTFHKVVELYLNKKRLEKIYSLNGYAGETMRRYWHNSPKKFIDNQRGKTNYYSHSLSSELLHSVKTILQSDFNDLREKYKIKNADSIRIPQYLYQETRCRHHFGKISLGRYFTNEFMLSPALDPEIRTLQLDASECPDQNLLLALLFTRYEPDLLTFPFNGGRSIAQKTIAYAQKLNERFPRQVTTDNVDCGEFYLQTRDLQVEKILSSGRNNPVLSSGLLKSCLKANFDSSRTFGLFNMYFDEELYHYSASRDTNLYSVVGITKILEDVETSQRNRSLYRDMQRFIAEDCTQLHNDEQIINKFKEFFTARILIRLDKEMIADNLQILSFSDDKAKLFNPSWWQKHGICYAFDSYFGKLEVVVKAAVDGLMQLRLSGASNHWIDYTRLVVNDKIIFDTCTPTWHNKPYIYNIDVKAGEEIKLQAEWQPHGSDT